MTRLVRTEESKSIVFPQSPWLSKDSMPKLKYNPLSLSLIFTLLRSFQAVSHGDWIIYIPPTVHRCPVFSRYLLALVSLMLAILRRGKCNIHYGFCLHFVIISDVETLFMYLLVICMVFWGKFLFSSYVHFLKIELFGFCFWVVRVGVFIYIY